MRNPCCHTCLSFILKFLNFLQAFVGVSIIVYSAYMLTQWQHHQLPPLNYAVNDLNSLSLPAPWFIYAFMGIGILVCFITFIGHIAAEAINGCCLCFYVILSTTFVLLEAGLVAFIAIDHHWEEDLPVDPTGELDRFRTLIQTNADVFQWVGIAIIIIQALSLLLAIVLRSLVSGQREDDDDIEGDYGFRNRTREPLLNAGSSQVPGSTRGDSDIWSSRMREKYGLSSQSTSTDM